MTTTAHPTGITLRPALAEDRFRVRRWLAEPAVAAWGNAASAEAEINIAIASSAAMCRIVERASRAIGYAQGIDGGLLGESWPARLPAGTWHLNVLLAASEGDDGALAGQALMLLAEEIFSSTLAVACAGVVSIRHEPLARAYERAGFRWQGVCADRLLGPAWLMLLERRQ